MSPSISQPVVAPYPPSFMFLTTKSSPVVLPQCSLAVPSLVVPVFLSLVISVLPSPLAPVPNSSVVSVLPSLVVPGLSSLVVLSLVVTSLTCWFFLSNLVVPSPVFSAFPSLSVPALHRPVVPSPVISAVSTRDQWSWRSQAWWSLLQWS